jgi:hypothetical protein
MKQQTMDRGTDALKAHLGSDCTMLDIRQSRRGWLQELLCCEARTEFKFFKGPEQQIAVAMEDGNCFCRVCCSSIHPFTMPVTELNTNAELLTVDRPCACSVGAGKCCCYQSIAVSSGGVALGGVKETCYYCVPSFKVMDDQEREIYIVHPPTCCGGCCINCCTEGNPCCGRGCCKMPFWVFPASAVGQTNGKAGEAAKVGKILKKPKSLMTELFTEANAFEVTFPTDATSEQKALLAGTSIFLNALFFEGDNSN